MNWISAVSSQTSLERAVDECTSYIKDGLSDTTPTLTLAFISSQHAHNYSIIPELVDQALGETLLMGCSASGVIGAGTEMEHVPGIAITAASLPDVELTPFHVGSDDLPDGDAPPDNWKDLTSTPTEPSPDFILLADPFSSSTAFFLMGLDYAFPQSVKIGGLASGSIQTGANTLFLGRDIYNSGTVGLSISGSIKIDPVVAQGCRPIGEPMRITSSSNNLLQELDGARPSDVLRGVLSTLTYRDQQIAQHSLFLGVLMDEFNESPVMGDFLIRNIIAMDVNSGIMRIGQKLEEGQVVQFHLRDALTSTLDLGNMLDRYVSEHPIYEDTGALMFSCLGRGHNLYGTANHDTDMFRTKVNSMPLTGFFCNGEIGPVGGTTFLHQYTTAFGIFRTKSYQQ